MAEDGLPAPPAERPPLFVIGPSHLHTCQLSDDVRVRVFGAMDVTIEAHVGLPVWSQRVPDALAEHSAAGRAPVWVVSDWKFNNFDYDAIVSAHGSPGSSSLFLDVLGHSGNVSHDYMQPLHLEVLARHGLDCIDEVLRRVPTTRLIFWCLYQRTKGRGSSSYPSWACYDAVVQRYRGHVIDIDEFTDAEEWRATMVADAGGHPSCAGYELMARMLQELA